MVIYPAARLDGIFGALANDTRRAILGLLARGERTVLELAGQFQISQPAVTKHLNVLERAGLIERKKRGRYRYCHLTPGSLEQASDWIEQMQGYWEERLQALEEYLAETDLSEEKL